MRKNIVVLSGAGISADSGISTFRDSNGLWANHKIEEVCTPEALKNNRNLVIDFYNSRRRELLDCKPNEAHKSLVKLEEYFNVEIVTQNIDDLHERAGSENITHLHGELRKLRSSVDETAIIDIDGWEQSVDARHSDGSLVRPYVVFFGESVPMFEKAVKIVEKADVLIIVGTSLAVYPAASLVGYCKATTTIYLLDPSPVKVGWIGSRVEHIQKRAAVGLPLLVTKLMDDRNSIVI